MSQKLSVDEILKINQDVYEENNLLKNSEERGKELLAGLEALDKKHKSIANPRGLGLHTAVDIVGGAATGASHVRLKNMYIDKGVIPYILPSRIPSYYQTNHSASALALLHKVCADNIRRKKFLI